MPLFPDSPHVPAEREIFAAVAALPDEERAAYLDLICEGRPDVRARVEAWLGEHESNAFMETVVDENRVHAELAGDRIGRYKLLQQIGEGGFGTVWMAEQVEPVSRRVALKVIKLGMDTREVIARFEQERQALAMMDHPNIAKVHDAGATQSGRPYFVMELVKGVPITQYCDEAGLGTRERLALFGDVCSAINHAHQKGVIHRDIKPSNVMVTLYAEKPVVKVIDFGIAKATQSKLTDKTLFTRFEQFIGTPVYMSPEQAAVSAVDIDTRSDIYALGVLLYELLTGKPPFDAKSLASAGYEEMRRIIREVEPPKPSSRLSTVMGEERTTLAKARHVTPDKLNRLVEPDLDWIVMKAIEKDRTRRYDTANGLAEDIQRFLLDEPVSATPPSAAYKFRKFARRNKKTIRVAAGITALLIAATAVSSWQAIRATKAERLAQGRLVEKDAALQDSEALSEFLVNVFKSPDPERDGRDIRVRDLLDAAAKKLENDLASQPERRAWLQFTLGRTYLSLGLAREAIVLQEKARDYYLSIHGMKRSQTLMAMSNLAISYAALDRYDDAIRTEEEVLAASGEVLGPESPETLRVMTHLAIYYSEAGRREESFKLLEEVRATSVRVLGLENLDTLAAMSELALSYAGAGRLKEALTLQEEVRRLTFEVGGPEHPDTLSAMNNLAIFYEDDGRAREALDLREEVLKLSLKVHGPEHPDVIHAMGNVALSYHRDGRIDEALKKEEEVLELSRRVNNPEHSDTLKAMINLANTYAGAGRPEEGLKLREDVLRIRCSIDGREHPRTLKVMAGLARAYGMAGHLDETIARHKEVLEIMRRVLAPNDELFSSTLQNLADIYEQTGHTAEAEAARAELATLNATPAPIEPPPTEPR